MDNSHLVDRPTLPRPSLTVLRIDRAANRVDRASRALNAPRPVANSGRAAGTGVGVKASVDNESVRVSTRRGRRGARRQPREVSKSLHERTCRRHVGWEF